MGGQPIRRREDAPKKTRRGEFRSCLVKKKFSRRTADNVVIRLAREQHDETIHAYKCEFCGCWHVGHRKQAWQ
jgi:uncharacterized membrane protein YgcG